MKTDTRIGCWNVRTMYRDGKLEEVLREARRYSLDILGISEARWNGFGEENVGDGYTLLYSGKPNEEDKHEYGVALLLNKSAKQCLLNWKPINERILTARFKTRARNVSIIQCYAPTEDTECEKKDHFYLQLDEILREIKRKDIVVLMGDLNAKVGSQNSSLEMIMGKHGVGTMNDNGERFIETCGMHGLVIGGTLFPHKECHKVTWVSPDGRTQNQIDHITISKTWRSSLLDVRNKRGADVGSDHHLVVGKIRLKLAAVHRRVETQPRRYDVAKLQDDETRERFGEAVRENLRNLNFDEEDSLDVMWGKVKEGYLEAGHTILGTTRKTTKPWITAETWQLIDARKEAKSLLHGNTSAAQYRDMERKVKRGVRRDKRKWGDDLARKAEDAAYKGDTRTLYQVIKEITRKPRKPSRPVKDKTGKLLCEPGEVLRRWKEYFQELLRVDQHDGIEAELNCARHTQNIEFDASPPSIAEILAAVKKLKSHKAPGLDNIPAEMLKADPLATVGILKPVLEKIWETEKIPEEWKKGAIVKLPKKGDLSDCKNWRGITLLPIVSKILNAIILYRIQNRVDAHLRSEQAGFRRGRNCTDQINTLRIILEASTEWQKALFLTFVDFEKAFDRVHQSAIWDTRNLIKEAYNGYTCQVIHEGKLSEPISPNIGVKQGCMLSPLLFIMITEVILDMLEQNGKGGLDWSDGTSLEYLAFADDLCLFSENSADMQRKLNDLVNLGNRVGMHVNREKTKSMRVMTADRTPFKINGQPIEDVDTFTYLGSKITPNGGTDEDIGNRINKARGAFAMLSPVWRSSAFRLQTKIRLFNACVKTVLLYGCETWKKTVQTTNKLQVFVNRCLRNILGIRWFDFVSNEELWRRTHQKPVAETVKERKWRWIGHVLRRTDDVPKEALTWHPEGGKRRLGRPRETWQRSVKKEMGQAGMSWEDVSELAQDRKEWRRFTSALCSPAEIGNK
ncbi:hypothetical protein JYU34_006321 [Plutella xylostella]|uniref:Reverse transcriptase domain-containing protein n=1 Tax=Plutella xylostella TaxID=51655 RepID=A0ABQ7QRQ8_PLUXY|nr:hypothetical protein JYU34_006321 [Plutella xylostella]